MKRDTLIGGLTKLGCIALGAMFLVTGYAKLKPQPGFPWTLDSVRLSLAFFAEYVDAYKILPSNLVNLAADILPFFELALGLWLLSRVAARISTAVASATMLLFFSAQLSVYLRGIKAGCGCELFSGEQIGPVSLTIDATLFLLCLAATISSYRAKRYPVAGATVQPTPA